MRSEGYGSCRVCASVCLSIKSHLTSGASVHRENATYSAGNKGKKICGIFSENVSLLKSSAPSLDGGSFIFPTENMLRIAHTQGQGVPQSVVMWHSTALLLGNARATFRSYTPHVNVFT